MDIKDWGEDSFIQFIAETFPVSPPITGIGDDCAVIPIDQEMAWLVTTDALVEGVHFLKDQISPHDLGYKAIAVSVSDIAAMGGLPNHAFLSIALPKNTDRNWLHKLMEGIKEACQKWGILLLGGDTVGSKKDIFLNITLTGTANQSKIKYRSHAIPGDIICVTEHLGDAAGGLKALQENVMRTPEVEYLLHTHFHPEVHLEQGIWLASQTGVHAMMDLSDGLHTDLRRLIKSSQKGAVVDVSNLPISGPLSRASADNGWNALQLAISGGEEYCLLLTASSEAFNDLQQAYEVKFKMPLHNIGRIVDAPTDLIYQKHGKSIQLELANFDHFQ